jgi:DNA end-binding protein Ku
MTARSIASLTLSFGLVSIPVKLYSATESASGVGFNFLSPEGGRVKQQYVSEATGEVVARADMKKGYEFEKGQFVVFTPDELKALEDGATHVVEIVSFVPEKSVDLLYYQLVASFDADFVERDRTSLRSERALGMARMKM